MSGSYQKMQYAIFSKPSLSEHICLRLVLFLKNNFKVLCTATYLCCTSDVCLQAAGMPALIFKGYLNSLFVNKLCWLHNTLACEHFRKREGHNSASVELGIRSNDFNRVTQGIGPLFQWELWFKVVFPVSFLHTGLPWKVTVPWRSLCGLPFQTVNNKSIGTAFQEVYAYTNVLKEWKKAHSTAQLTVMLKLLCYWWN